MNGERVGLWSAPPGRPQIFRYDDAWLKNEARRVLSLSLPFTVGNEPLRGASVANFFENLLPDNDQIRRRIQTRFHADSGSAFDLLATIGRDCVGAIQLLPENHEPPEMKKIQAKRLDEAGVAQAIRATLSTGSALAGDKSDEFRFSIAGAQEKTALLYHNGNWCIPTGATPTTHIFKLPLGLVGGMAADMRNSVENEWLCLQILKTYGLPVAECEMARFAEHRVLIVKRFDRAPASGWIARLPQEDFCQALGCAPSDKYEAEGGPGMGDILRVLVGSSRSEEDRRNFLRAQLLFWILAATDGHAKNFSLFHERGGSYRLTPFYDVLSAWPIIGKGPNLLAWPKAKLAMAVRSKNAHWKLSDIKRRHWEHLGRRSGLGDDGTWIDQMVDTTPLVIEHVRSLIPAGFPGAVAEAIFTGMRQQVAQLTSNQRT
ncbi:MAG: type II toxin-antitoxin system HipA family toxin [Verrucomicrobia bacterium]|nr:type II toxin-antitoxin system HipA family toxin [Verrucomicrobiota bacterium]